MAAKCLLVKSIIESPRIIGEYSVDRVTGTVLVPDKTTLAKKNWHELRNLTITHVEFHFLYSLGFTLSDG